MKSFETVVRCVKIRPYFLESKEWSFSRPKTEMLYFGLGGGRVG